MKNYESELFRRADDKGHLQLSDTQLHLHDLALHLDAYKGAATSMDRQIDWLVQEISGHHLPRAIGNTARVKRVNNAVWGSAALLISAGVHLREFDRSVLQLDPL